MAATRNGMTSKIGSPAHRNKSFAFQDYRRTSASRRCPISWRISSKWPTRQCTGRPDGRRWSSRL